MVEELEIRVIFRIKRDGNVFNAWADKIESIVAEYEPAILVLDENGEILGPIYIVGKND